jgi:uncharacterized SAM-dependent methyltransferase
MIALVLLIIICDTKNSEIGIQCDWNGVGNVFNEEISLVSIFDRFIVVSISPMIFHSSSRSPQKVLQKQISFLKKGIVDPSLHYHSPRQSEAWEKVFQAHCPVLRDKSFVAIYRQLFSRFSSSQTKAFHLIGLGCGTGVKEQWIGRSMRRVGKDLRHFTAVDVSEELCRMSMKKLNPLSRRNPQAWVMDLDGVGSLRKWLDHENRSERRVYTFFGLVPNLASESVSKIWRALLRPGDQLLISANLAPVSESDESDLDQAVKRILPQYRNQETRRWLEILFREQGISKKWISPLRFEIENQKGLRSIVVRTDILRDFKWSMGTQALDMKKSQSLKVFQSRRWTPQAFEKWMVKSGLKIRESRITPNREEGVWWVEK